MRINRYVAAATGLARRRADELINDGQVKVDNIKAENGQQVKAGQIVTLKDKQLRLQTNTVLVMLNKPVGYVVSKKGQGAPTIYDLLGENYLKLKPIGRLDKDSSGLLLLSNDGQLINSLAHPSFNKQKVYEITVDRKLNQDDLKRLQAGVRLDDGLSKLSVINTQDKKVTVGLSEGRNRQVRRTFDTIGLKVNKLHRTKFGEYELGSLESGKYTQIAKQ